MTRKEIASEIDTISQVVNQLSQNVMVNRSYVARYTGVIISELGYISNKLNVLKTGVEAEAEEASDK